MAHKHYYATYGGSDRPALVAFPDYESFRHAMTVARAIASANETGRKRLVRVSRDFADSVYMFRHREPTSHSIAELGIEGVRVWEPR